jgi:stress response protein YsnF
MDGPAISEEEHEMPLYEEEVVANTEVKPKERVRLDKKTETETETVSGDVRKERIDVEGDAPRGG